MPMKFQPSQLKLAIEQYLDTAEHTLCRFLCGLPTVRTRAHRPTENASSMKASNKLYKRRSRRTTTEEPGFNHMAQNGRWAFALEQLDGVVPSHSTLGGAASGEDNFGLLVGRSCHLGSC